MGAVAGGLGGLTGYVGDNLGSGLGGLSNGLVAQNQFSANGAQILAPVTGAQANTAYDQTQDALSQQNAFLQALQAQNGAGNQSAVYSQLQGIANGTGPNPALAQLNQTTGQNIQNQAALMASQRGSGANVGLLARQAAMQGGNLQQQAVGQGATLAAQQQMNAINSAGNIAGQQVQNQAGALQSYNQAAQSEQQNLLNSIQGANNARVGLVSNQNNNNEQVASQNAGAKNAFNQSLIQGGGSALGLAAGGEVPQVASPQPAMSTGPSSFVGKFLYSSAPDQTNAAQAGIASNQPQVQYPQAQGSQKMGQGLGSIMSEMMAKGGMAKKPVTGPMLAAKGKEVPGKASVKGDSLKNDTVKALLSPGEIVIPRHITQGKNAPAEAAKFVAAILSKKAKK